MTDGRAGRVFSAEARIRLRMRQVEITDTCWLWRGALTDEGYPKNKEHRTLYALMVGPIPEGLQLDHLCSVRRCVNPDHLEPVTNAENARRAAERRTVCRNGHPRAHVRITCGKRVCRVCEGDAQRRYHTRKAGIA